MTLARRPLLLHHPLPVPKATCRTFSSSSKRPQQQYGYEYRQKPPPRSPYIDHWRRNLLVGATGVGGVYYVAHLEQVPETGRYRFMDVSPAMESEMAKETFQAVLNQYNGQFMSPHNPVVRYVSHVAGRIVSSAGLGRVVPGRMDVGERRRGEAIFGGMFGRSQEEPSGGDEWGEDVAEQGQEWEIYVINDPKTRNAFVLPNRKIFVFTGILPVAQGEDGLATVLGHEIAHQVVRHGAERMSQVKFLMGLGYLLYFMGIDLGLTNLGLTLLLELPNSRKQESEADRVGLKLMASACFDPREAPSLWVRMDQAEGSKGGSLASIDFLSTHPSNEKRMKQLESWVSEALDARATAACSGDLPSRFEEFREDVSRRLGVGVPTPAPSAPVPRVSRQDQVYSSTTSDEPTQFGFGQELEQEQEQEQGQGQGPPTKPVSDTDEQWLRWIGGRRR